jgi:hypothetical protein
MKEEERHRRAFELYYILGLSGKRTINQRVMAVCEKYGHDKSTVYKWKKEFDWELKETVRNDIMAAAESKFSPEAILTVRYDLLIIAQEIVEEYLSYILTPEGKRLKIRNPLDFKRIIEAVNALGGAPPTKETKEISGSIDHHVHTDNDLMNSLRKVQEDVNSEGLPDPGAGESVGGDGLPINDGAKTVEGGEVEVPSDGRSGASNADNESSEE